MLISDPELGNPANGTKKSQRYNSARFPWNEERTESSSQRYTWKYWVLGNTDGEHVTPWHSLVKFLGSRGKDLFLQAPRKHIRALVVEKSSPWGGFTAGKDWGVSTEFQGKECVTQVNYTQSSCHTSIKAIGKTFHTENISWRIHDKTYSTASPFWKKKKLIK